MLWYCFFKQKSLFNSTRKFYWKQRASECLLCLGPADVSQNNIDYYRQILIHFSENLAFGSWWRAFVCSPEGWEQEQWHCLDVSKQDTAVEEHLLPKQINRKLPFPKSLPEAAMGLLFTCCFYLTWDCESACDQNSTGTCVLLPGFQLYLLPIEQ